MFTKLNKLQGKLFNVEVENPTYKKLSQFNENEVLLVRGCYINKKSRYGNEPVFIVEDVKKNIYFVVSPKHHLETLEAIITSPELVEGVNDNKCFIKVTKYFSNKFKKNCSDFEFIDYDINNFYKINEISPEKGIF